ncbi:MAG: bifunctional oligoribonuclease/PAP phosphatase NrnA [Oscillospiraceae bacterium]|nr:bifunctional oligoribonuclease/PAP phosphatase NrnA [Oscillospiraceae bacterium]
MIHETTRLTNKEVAAWLLERDGFLILTHRRPDGDALGSAAGLCAGLRAIGKQAYILENPETTERYLEYTHNYLPPPDFVPQVVISVDTADAGILQKNAWVYAERVDLCIDHHASNTGYAAYSCVDTDCAACGEVVYEILMALSGEISAAATPLYVALSTDTGCFCYANVTAETLEIASRLVRAGADHWRVNKRLFRTKSRARMALDGALLSGLRFSHDDRVALALVTQARMAETGVTEDDLDDIANIPNQAEGVQVGIVVRELPDGSCKISVRTIPGVDANAICRKFGGGGHPMAAGCVVDMEPEDAAVALEIAAGEALGM